MAHQRRLRAVWQSAGWPLQEMARPAPKRAMRLPFMVWMALARATPELGDDDRPGLAEPPAPT